MTDQEREPAATGAAVPVGSPEPAAEAILQDVRPGHGTAERPLRSAAVVMAKDV
ncbi:hypothetical protein [Actinoplanes sp. NPDC049316]|uniref:hypothetical protein n=1 Tax=Actinoplanes sp. NPDC049316 TaxID=3154727 RepID=UPI00342D9639